MTLYDILGKNERAPFLFLGSGFTRHYYDTPDWKGILEKFAPRPFNAYISQIGNNYPQIASKIAEELTAKFWELPESDTLQQKYKNFVVSNSSYLKLLISEYLKSESLRVGIPDEWKDELEILRNAPVDGVITTNWDDLAEQIFPKFKTYIGQEELLFNKSYNIGEIYKIHGCFKRPESLVLTKEDYDEYNNKYAYLASKLLTIFVEHPVIFIGYSINDSNIKAIIKSLVCCLSQDNINRLKNNMIFVDWKPDPNFNLQVENSTFLLSEGVSFPCVKILTHSFKPIYETMQNFTRQIPTNVLRLYKDSFYEIVYSQRPEKKLCVVEEKDLMNRTDVEFVCGYGVIGRYHSAVGYTGIKALELFKDLLSENINYDPTQILTKTLPNIQGYVPIYRYLRVVGINSNAEYVGNSLGVNYGLNKGADFQSYFRYPTAANEFIDGRNLSELITDNDVNKVICAIPYMNLQEEDLEILREFLIAKLNQYMVLKNNYSSYYRKAVCFYDWKKFGW